MGAGDGDDPLKMRSFDSEDIVAVECHWKRGFARRIAWLAIFLLLVPNFLRADDSSTHPAANQDNSAQFKRLSLWQLGDVRVATASKEPEEIWNTLAAIYVLTQQDIRRSGATSIPEVLRLVPGVEVARIDSDHWSVGIRGFGSEFSKSVLTDGRSVYSPLFSGVYWNVQNVMPEDVERIEVIRGPGGTIWGANAVNGVINIITKSARETHGGLAAVAVTRGQNSPGHAPRVFAYFCE